jgi:hypothetical protein
MLDLAIAMGVAVKTPLLWRASGCVPYTFDRVQRSLARHAHNERLTRRGYERLRADAAGKYGCIDLTVVQRIAGHGLRQKY